MPTLWETQKRKDVNGKGHGNVIWAACGGCGKERWVSELKRKPISDICQACSGKVKSGGNNPHWRGGRYKGTDGYIYIKLLPDDFFFPMASERGYVLEHRLVIAQHLQRCLLQWETVHHKGAKYPLGSIENKSDNRYPENLELLPNPKKHDALSRMIKYIRKLEREVEILRRQNETH